MVGLESDESDFIASAQNMSESQALAEQAQIRIEITRCNNEIAAAKIQRDVKATAFLGQKLQGLLMRASLIKKRLHVLAQTNQYQRVREAIYLLCDVETRTRIFDYAVGTTEEP